MIFEGLFPAYISRLSYVFKKMHPMLFREYMGRPRFIDEKKLESFKPNGQLKNEKYGEGKDFLGSVYRTFGEKWIIADLHAELYYKALLRAWPDIHFCVVIRDPRDCVCAGLYWQDFPKTCQNRTAWFYKNLFSWMLSVHVAQHIQTNYPDHITIVNSNQFQTDTNITPLLGLSSQWKNDLPKQAYYSFVKNGTFTTPNENEFLELLTPKERAIIQGLCAETMRQYGYAFEDLPQANLMKLRFIKSLVFRLSARSPSLALGLINLLFSPSEHVKTQLNRFKQFIKDMNNF